MFKSLKARVAAIRHHPEVEELAQNSKQLLALELRRLNRRLKARTQGGIEPLCNR